MYRVKILDTKDNTYQFALGYSRIAKTSYEQREEHKQLFWYMIRQRLVALCFIVVMVTASVLSKSVLSEEYGLFAIIGLVIGIPVLLYNKPVGLGGNWNE